MGRNAFRFFIPVTVFASLLVMASSMALAGPVYSLTDLCRAADKNAEVIKIAEEDLFIAQQEKVRARSVLIPRATLFGSYINYNNDDSTNPDVTSYGGKLTQSFTLNGRELIAYDVSKKGIEKANFSKEGIRSDYMFEVAQAYVLTVSRMRLMEVADADVKRLLAHRDSVREKLAVGNVTKTALYRAEAELSRARTDLIVAANEVESARASIVRLTGIEKDFQVSDKGLEHVDALETNPEQIADRALSRRYEVKSAQKELEIATKTVAYEKGEYWPSVNLVGGYRENDIRYDTGAGARNTYDAEAGYIQAELEFVLFDGGLRRAQVRQAKARQRQAQAALSNREKEIRLESENAYLQYVTAKNTWINLQDEVTSASENYKAVDMQFAYGMANSVDLMDANSLLVSAQRRLSQAKYAYYLAILRILHIQSDIMDTLLTG